MIDNIYKNYHLTKLETSFNLYRHTLDTEHTTIPGVRISLLQKNSTDLHCEGNVALNGKLYKVRLESSIGLDMKCINDKFGEEGMRQFVHKFRQDRTCVDLEPHMKEYERHTTK